MVDMMVTLALVVVATVVPVLTLVRDGRNSPAPSDSARRALRHVTLAAVVAAASLGAVLTLTASALLGGVPALPGASPRVLIAVPAVALVGYLGVLTLGELTLPRPTGPVREAHVLRRSPGDVAPPTDRHLVRAWAGTTFGTAVVLALVASGPRTVSRIVGRYESVTAAPFPGWWTGLPVVASVAVTLLAVAAVTRLIASRSALAGVDPAWDLWLRRRVARRALRSVQLVLGLTVAGLLLIASVGLRGLASGGDGMRAAPPSPVHEVAGWTLTAVALAVGVLALVLALRPARDPAPQPSPAPEAEVSR